MSEAKGVPIMDLPGLVANAGARIKEKGDSKAASQFMAAAAILYQVMSGLASEAAIEAANESSDVEDSNDE